jgi:formylglycine-generating enzyme required for sulfatase activity
MAKGISFSLVLLVLFLSFGCGKKEENPPLGVRNSSEEHSPPGLQVVSSQQETDNPTWQPPSGFTVVSDEGWDKSTGCAIEIEHIKSGILLRLIPAGEFDMGSPDNEEGRGRYGDEGPVHNVKISKPFYMGKYEITQAQWKAVMGADNNPSDFKGDNLPVETVSWNDAQEFLKKASDGLRLPTEAEWEYACRAGTTTPFNTGNNITTDQANYNGNYPYAGNPKGEYRVKTTPVGTFRPNAWGLYDMHGNVWEWCSDWYAQKYYEECKNGVTDPSGPGNGARRVLRGGSWFNNARGMRSAFRYWGGPADRTGDIGFRVAVPARANN